MELTRTRTAMGQAERALAALEAAVDDSDGFRDAFVSCVGMIQRVGSILDEESKGHRTSAFGEFWKTSRDDLLFQFMADVRNAEFKRGEDRTTSHHEIGLSEALTMRSSVSIEVIRDDEVVERRTYDEPPPEAASWRGPTHTITWYFAGGARDGQEVLGLVRSYVTWLRDAIMEQAEALTTD